MPVISTINSFPDLKTSHGSNLIAPFIDNWHIDVINEASHLASCRRAVRSTHTFVDVTLNSALRRKPNLFQQTVANTRCALCADFMPEAVTKTLLFAYLK